MLHGHLRKLLDAASGFPLLVAYTVQSPLTGHDRALTNHGLRSSCDCLGYEGVENGRFDIYHR